MTLSRLLILSGGTAAIALAIGCSNGGQDPEPASGKDAAPAAASTAATHEMIAAGEAIYAANCSACHGKTGKGDGPAAGALKPPPRDHTDRAYMDTLSDDDLKKVIVIGGAITGRPLMPGHPQIRGKELDSLVAYVRWLSRKK